jgi:16S rRNA (uracil1498-N3)-methyltransferase
VSEHVPRFLIRAPAALGELVTLSDDEAQHARVRRLAPGAPVALFDGAGASWIGEVVAVRRGRCEVRLTAARPAREAESPLALTLAIGALKADKLDWVVEKATELGAACIQPFASAFTVARPSPARQARWRQIALSAAKQCGRAVIPTVAAPLDFADLLSRPADARLLLAERDAATPLATVRLTAPRSLLLAIGAEGGFSCDELAAARAAGFDLVRLGPRILRAETAAVAACALCQARWGDLAETGGT